MQNFPNPFNPVTKIAYSVPRPVHVRITLYDSMGREVLILVNSKKDTGFYETILNAENLSSGIYFYTMKAGNFIKSHKLLLLK